MSRCVDGYMPTMDKLTCGLVQGAACSQDTDCATQACRGGYCCSSYSAHECSWCAQSSGACNACYPGFELSNGGCVGGAYDDSNDDVPAIVVAVALMVVVVIASSIGFALW